MLPPQFMQKKGEGSKAFGPEKKADSPKNLFGKKNKDVSTKALKFGRKV